MDNYTFYQASTKDIPLLIELRVKVLVAANKLDNKTDMSLVKKETSLYYNNHFQDDRHIAYLSSFNNIIIATGAICFYHVMPTFHNPTGKKAYIMNMYTSHNHRRKGAAKKIINLLVNEAHKQSIYDISLETTTLGKPLYLHCGFTPTEHEMTLSYIKTSLSIILAILLPISLFFN